jgi:catechol 2,3-dioxygenase-like lactoylglutathione lyase family enzyme
MLAGQEFLGFIPVADFATARAFYGGTLGLPVLEEHGFAVVVDAGGTPLRLTEVRAFTPQPFTIAGWSVADVHALARALAAAGVALERFDGMGQDDEGVWTAPGGERVAWFKDPFGNLLSVSSPASD